ncbi:MAG: YhcH/YjgK/YiaL family protein [Bacteroidota bacterium]|nr:MAG: YhcH/YjgK/YiaL family protein [Bacteroidota bacterium]
MAIVGNLRTLASQTSHTRILQALDYLSQTDLNAIFLTLSEGSSKTMEIDGKALFAIFQTYTSKTGETIKMEGHRQYIDVQYIFEGEEKILLASEEDITEADTYNVEKDYFFPKVAAFSSVILRQGEGAVLTPLDLHGPGYCVDKPGIVKKVVVKVAV